MTEKNIPVFTVLDTESSHGRYSQSTKEITFDDLVKFHGHACDGLYRGTYALSVAFKILFPNGVIDRTDLRAISRNSPSDLPLLWIPEAYFPCEAGQSAPDHMRSSHPSAIQVPLPLHPRPLSGIPDCSLFPFR